MCNAKCKPLISAALSPSLTWDNQRESESSGSATTIAAINRRNADGFYLNWIWTWDGLTSIAVIIFPAIYVGRSGDILQSESYFSKWFIFFVDCEVSQKCFWKSSESFSLIMIKVSGSFNSCGFFVLYFSQNFLCEKGRRPKSDIDAFLLLSEPNDLWVIWKVKNMKHFQLSCG